MRKYRKREHIENYLRSTYIGDPLFEDIFLYHDSLPKFDFDEIDTKVEFLGKKIDFPLMINAITGGNEFSEEINESLAKIASKYNIPMAVGSQTIALEDEDSWSSFKCAREIIKDGILISNLNGHATVEEAKKAIDLIEADAIQIHLNPAQEIAMEEGDRIFKDVLSNIERLVKELDIDVIVKEVGFGLSRKVIRELYDLGVKYVDVSGFGGTNFFEIENLRTPNDDLSELYSWGNPTAMTLIEAKNLGLEDLTIIGSGGIRSSMDLIKSIVIGADIAGISGEILRYLVHGGYDYADQYIENMIHKSKIIMLLAGSKNIRELKKIDYKVTGKLKDLL